MQVRYQRGYLRLGQRKTGPDRWEFLWWDSEPSGVRVRRKDIIGTGPTDQRSTTFADPKWQNLSH
jgi:hypothetical protein